MAACAIVAASDFNGRDFLARHARGAFDYVLAADAGYAHLRDAGIAPDAALGDFDSLGFVPQDVETVRHPAQKDESDMELALTFAVERGFEEFFVYGALGRRLDHTIANLQLLARLSEQGFRMTAIDSRSAIRVLTGPAAFDIPAREGIVSVFAACDEALGVTEEGLYYPLDDFTLSSRTSRGLSNELTGRPARVSVRSGTLYIFYPLESPA